ncbi:MAG: LPS export ABC transporter periplasmic protein LptC, partial [Cyclobacteriaceae bacterium]|nr:LPS export ABC transporter periplasmic protein LptC [Cyclobacteriaceae bacterium]
MKNLISFPPFALIIMLMILLPISGVGQQKIILKNADSGEDKVDENGTKYTLFKGNVWFIRGTVNIYCNEAHGYGAPDSKVKLFGNVRIIDKDVHITSKNAFYYSETQLIQLREDVVFRQSNGITVYTDFLDYNRDKKVAMYFNGGRLVDKESVLTSKRGYFNEATGMASFKSDVDGKNPEWTLTADTLQYDTRERIIYFHDKTNLVDAKGNMAEYYAGQYNTITKQSQLRTGKFETESYILEGNTIEIDDVKKLYKARGDVFLLSKTDDLIITGESAYYDQLNGITKIYDHPVMKMASAPGDTLYLSADTLLSVETENDSNEVLYA